MVLHLCVLGLASAAVAAAERNPTHPIHLVRYSEESEQKVQAILDDTERMNKPYAERDAVMAAQKAEWQAKMRLFDERQRWRADERKRRAAEPPKKRL